MLKHLFLSLLLCSSVFASQHGIAMHGELKYKADESFDYVNKDAPVGGQIRLGIVGTFDSFNPFVIKGTAPAGLNVLTEMLVYERLMARSSDEPFSLYCHIAESVNVADDRSSIQFNLRPQAQWADGKPITTRDINFSFATLKTKGRPNLRLFYSKVKSVEVINDRQIKFTFDKLPNENRYDPELPLLMGLMPILPEHLLKDKDFEKLTRKDILGSGPYEIKEANVGHSITYARRKEYWAWNLPHIKGYYNFQTVRFDYYRNSSVALEAFKAGEYDKEEIENPNIWTNEFKIKAVSDGKLKLQKFKHALPVGFKGFVFNSRREIFADREVRKALSEVFDFDWVNSRLFQSAYERATSYYDNTELACCGPAGTAERDLFKPFMSSIDSKMLEYDFQTKEPGESYREKVIKAGQALDKAGWIIKNGARLNEKTGKPMQFEILLYQPSDEKLALAYARNLERLGVKVNVRVVDSAQFEKRRLDFDYDMIINTWGHTLSPGREQSFYFSVKSADESGSRNYAGVKNPIVDSICQSLATAKDRGELIAASRALDRTLLWGHYVVPLYYNAKINLAYWDKLRHPELKPNVGIVLSTWWSKDAEKEQQK